MTVVLEQRMLALAKANETRCQRSELKRSIRAGLAEPADVVAGAALWASGMRVRDVLLATPGYGQSRVDKLLRMTGTSSAATLRSLSDRQRDAIVGALRFRHRRAPSESAVRRAA